MGRLTGRQRLLVLILLAAVGYWVIDSTLISAKPRSVQAGQQPEADTTPSARWEDVSDVLSAFAGAPYQSVDERIQSLDRDLFLPTAAVERLFASAEEEEAREQGDEVRENEPPQPGFADAHTLVGVMLGKAPMAIVDGEHLLPIGAEIDGYRLIEVYRDHAVFECLEAGARVRLTVSGRAR